MHAFETAQQLRFDAVEIFAPGPEAVDRAELHRLVDGSGLTIAMVGTGAGMVKRGFNSSDREASTRKRAVGLSRKWPTLVPNSVAAQLSDRCSGTMVSTALGYLQDSLNHL